MKIIIKFKKKITTLNYDLNEIKKRPKRKHGASVSALYSFGRLTAKKNYPYIDNEIQN
jgi:hypothetical protein